MINHGSAAHFVPACGLHRISLFRASGETLGRLEFDALENTRDPCLLGWAINSVGTQSYPTPPRRLPGAPTRTARGMSGLLSDMPCIKKIHKKNRRQYTGQQPGTKSAFRPGDKPLINLG